MAVRFVLGPAGSGKTHRCLLGLREAERAGRHAIYLVPEQFTYLADRELLSGGDADLQHLLGGDDPEMSDRGDDRRLGSADRGGEAVVLQGVPELLQDRQDRVDGALDRRPEARPERT